MSDIHATHKQDMGDGRELSSKTPIPQPMEPELGEAECIWAMAGRNMGFKETALQPAETIRRTGDLTEADYDRAIGIMVRTKRASTSFLQREIGLTYNAAAKLMERAEADGFVSKPDAVGKRHVAADPIEAAADNRLIVGFMLDCNAIGQNSAAENLVRGIKAEAVRRKMEMR